MKDENCSNQLYTALDKLRPAYFEQYEWSALSNLPRFCGVLSFIFFVLMIDCNNFFLKFVLYIHPAHDLMKYRVALWGFCSLATAKEWFEYTSNEFCHRVGPFAWLTIYTCGVETMLVIKCSEGMFNDPIPNYVKIIWVCIGTGIFWLGLIAWMNDQREAEKIDETKTKDFNPYNPEVDVVNHNKRKNK